MNGMKLNKLGLIALLAVLFGSSCFFNNAPSNEIYKAGIQHSRDSLNTVFADPELSILKPADVDVFEGLHFYEIDEKYCVKAQFTKNVGEEFEMQTSTERLPVYRPYGTATFELEGKSCQLTIFQNVELAKREGYENYLFLPFTDESSGFDSYGGGRYLDFTTDDLVDLTIDFNLCYNPYCAYNNRFSCPIPPSENHVPLSILAGVKKWHD